MNISRRSLVSASLGGGVFTVLVSSNSYAQSGTPDASTRIVEGANGQIEVPVSPERIVALDSYSAAIVADIGGPLVGVPEFDLDGWMFVYKDALTDISTVGPNGEPNLEKILSLEPDLILCITAPWGTDNLTNLEAIAPTVLGDYTVPDAWKALADVFAIAAGREEGLKAIKDQYASRVEDIRTTYKDVLEQTTWAVAIGWGASDGQFELYYPDSPPGTILSDIGVNWVEAAANGTDGSGSFSLEELHLLQDADVILTYGTRDSEAEKSTQIMIDNAAFQRLPAVANDQVHIWRLVVPASYGEALVFLDQIESVLIGLA